MRSLLLALAAAPDRPRPPRTPATPPSPPSTAPRSCCSFHPVSERRQGADDPRGPRLGRLAPDRPERGQRRDDRQRRRRRAAQGRVQRPHVGLARLRQLRRHRDRRRADAEARDVHGADRLARAAARGAARQGRRPARGHDRRLLRRRDRALDRRADKRIDAIAPIIAWHSPETSLYKEETVKGGWSTALYAAGVPTSKGRLDPHITSAFAHRRRHRQADAPRTAPGSPRRGPGDLVKQITVPTFLVEGTADTLFTLNEAITNYAILKGNGVPGQDDVVLRRPRRLPDRRRPAGHIEAAVVAWLKRYVGAGRDRRHRPALRVARRRRPVALGRRLPGRRRARRSPRPAPARSR